MRRRSKWLRRIGWAAVWGISLIALFYVHQGWQGRRAWKAYVAEAEAAGERLDPESIIPPPIPDDQNLAMAPLFKPLFEYEQTGGIRGQVTWKDPAQKEALEKFKLPGEWTPSVTAGWRQGALTDLAAWQARFATAGEIEPTGDPAQGVLKTLSQFDPWLKQLEEAAATRPRSRFPFRYTNSIAMQYPHASPSQGLGQILRLRAIARLRANQVEEASQDVLLMFRLQEALGADPLLIAHLVAISIQEMAAIALWEGIATHRWNDQQLRGFQERLATINQAAQVDRAIRGERNLFGFAAMEMLRSERRDLARVFTEMHAMTTTSSNAFAPAVALIPGGWIDMNKAAIGTFYQKVLNVTEANPPRFHKDRADALMKEIEGDGPLRRDPRLPFARLVAPVFLSIPSRSAASQGTIDLALIALALERHRLRHGTYPEALEKIDQDLRGPRGIPQDCVTGRPAHYTLNGDGSYLLYFEGWNSRDDGGKVAFKKNSKTSVDFAEGDWVWPQPVEP